MAEIWFRIDALNENSERRWGRMKVNEMLRHCRLVLQIPTGETILPKSSPLVKAIGIMTRKEMALFNNGIPRNMPTFEILRCSGAEDFETERQKLLVAIKRYLELEECCGLPIHHELFGGMNHDNWGFLEYKHLHHHLKQFRV